jgi:probable rRNA maturation factor
VIRLELNQGRLRGGSRLPRAVVAKMLREISRGLRLRRDVAFSAAFVSPREMRRLNKAYRGRDYVTDVLSFPYPKGDVRGEILVSYEKAKQQAEEMGHSVREELVFLLVHGILHASGYDHETSRQAAKMFPLQTKILKRLGVDSRL